MDAERQRLINEAARISNDIDQQIIDIEYYNCLHPFQKPVSTEQLPSLRHWKRGLDQMLASEAARGNHPSVVPIKAHRRNLVPVQLTREQARDTFFGGKNQN